MSNRLYIHARTKLVRYEGPCSYGTVHPCSDGVARTSRREVGTSVLSRYELIWITAGRLAIGFAKARTSFDGTGIVGLAENYRRQVLTIQLQKESRGAE